MVYGKNIRRRRTRNLISTALIILTLILAVALAPKVDAATVTLHFQTTITTPGTSITFNGLTYHNGDSGTFNTGTSYTAVANPDAGYGFTGWGTISSNSSCINITSPHTVTTTVTLNCDGATLQASFAVAYPITFNTDPTSGVAINWTLPSYPPTQTFTYINGQSATYPWQHYGIVADPKNTGDTFSYWTASGGACCIFPFLGVIRSLPQSRGGNRLGGWEFGSGIQLGDSSKFQRHVQFQLD